MRIWAMTKIAHKINREVVQTFAFARPSDLSGWTAVITELCKPLDLSVPVILPKHITELARFSRTVFKPADFMESVSFDTFEMEIFPEKKKETHTEYFFDQD